MFKPENLESNGFRVLTKEQMRNIYGSIRQFRDDLCISQDYMATKLGISQSTYQKIESGTVKLTEERLIEIANILGKDIEEFKLRRKDQVSKNDIHALEEIIVLQSKEISELKNELQTKSLELAKFKLNANMHIPIPQTTNI